MKTKDQIQTEALIAISNKRLAGVEISMGVGKTRIGLKHMASNYTDVAKFLIVAPKRSIFTSWVDEMKENNFEYLKEHCTFSTYISLNNQDFDFDYIYLDECHSLKANHNDWLKMYIKRGGKIIGLTGTYPVQKSTEKGKMCNFYCPKVYEYNVDDAVADKILNDYEIFVHELQLNNHPSIPVSGKNGDFMTTEVKQYDYWTQRLLTANPGKDEQICRIQRMKILQGFISKEEYALKLLKEQKDKTIIFANTQDQADRLCEYSYHSKNSNSEYNLISFKKNNIKKLSAVEQLSEGVTIPDLKVGIIMHSYSNNRKAAQKIGRLLRLNPKDKATVHILCYANTIDKEWVSSALSNFNQNKINWIKL